MRAWLREVKDALLALATRFFQNEPANPFERILFEAATSAVELLIRSRAIGGSHV